MTAEVRGTVGAGAPACRPRLCGEEETFNGSVLIKCFFHQTTLSVCSGTR